MLQCLRLPGSEDGVRTLNLITLRAVALSSQIIFYFKMRMMINRKKELKTQIQTDLLSSTNLNPIKAI
jgi:hypothetical protein